MKALPVIQRVKAIGLPWADWAADVLTRYDRWTYATRLPLSFFTARLRPKPGTTLIQRLEHVHHHGFASNISLNLKVDQHVLRSDTTQVFPAGPLLLQMVRTLQRIDLPARPRVSLDRYILRTDASTRSASFDLTARTGPWAIPSKVFATPDMVQREPSPQPEVRRRAPAGRLQMSLAEMPRQLAQRGRRVSDMPLSPLRMQLRRAAPIIATMPDPPPLLAPSSWRPSPSTKARGPDPTGQPISVNQLAGQVLKEIDRRVTARRERMGQR